jgi:hypothetical protein
MMQDRINHSLTNSRYTGSMEREGLMLRIIVKLLVLVFWILFIVSLVKGLHR